MEKKYCALCKGVIEDIHPLPNPKAINPPCLCFSCLSRIWVAFKPYFTDGYAESKTVEEYKDDQASIKELEERVKKLEREASNRNLESTIKKAADHFQELYRCSPVLPGRRL